MSLVRGDLEQACRFCDQGFYIPTGASTCQGKLSVLIRIECPDCTTIGCQSRSSCFTCPHGEFYDLEAQKCPTSCLGKLKGWFRFTGAPTDGFYCRSNWRALTWSCRYGHLRGLLLGVRTRVGNIEVSIQEYNLCSCWTIQWVRFHPTAHHYSPKKGNTRRDNRERRDARTDIPDCYVSHRSFYIHRSYNTTDTEEEKPMLFYTDRWTKPRPWSTRLSLMDGVDYLLEEKQ